MVCCCSLLPVYLSIRISVFSYTISFSTSYAGINSGFYVYNETVPIDFNYSASNGKRAVTWGVDGERFSPYPLSNWRSGSPYKIFNGVFNISEIGEPRYIYNFHYPNRFSELPPFAVGSVYEKNVYASYIKDYVYPIIDTITINSTIDYTVVYNSVFEEAKALYFNLKRKGVFYSNA